MTSHPITPPPPHLLKKFSAQAQDETKKRNGAGYLKTFATLCIEWAMNCQSTSNDRQIRSSEIQPPPELVREWLGEQYGVPTAPGEATSHVATQAARWGADQELEACCEWLGSIWPVVNVPIDELRAARRPKPPTLKEQALRILVENGTTLDGRIELEPEDIPIIRRALEALPND